MRDDYELYRRKSTRRLEIAIKRLSEFFSSYLANDITTDSVEKYINRRAGDDLADVRIREQSLADVALNIGSLGAACLLHIKRFGVRRHAPLQRLDRLGRFFFAAAAGNDRKRNDGCDDCNGHELA